MKSFFPVRSCTTAGWPSAWLSVRPAGWSILRLAAVGTVCASLHSRCFLLFLRHHHLPGQLLEKLWKTPPPLSKPSDASIGHSPEPARGHGKRSVRRWWFFFCFLFLLFPHFHYYNCHRDFFSRVFSVVIQQWPPRRIITRQRRVDDVILSTSRARRRIRTATQPSGSGLLRWPGWRKIAFLWATLKPRKCKRNASGFAEKKYKKREQVFCAGLFFLVVVKEMPL